MSVFSMSSSSDVYRKLMIGESSSDLLILSVWF